MPFVAAVAFVMYQEDHLLLDDMIHCSSRGGGVWEVHKCIEPCSAIQNYTSHFLYGNSCK